MYNSVICALGTADNVFMQEMHMQKRYSTIPGWKEFVKMLICKPSYGEFGVGGQDLESYSKPCCRPELPSSKLSDIVVGVILDAMLITSHGNFLPKIPGSSGRRSR